MELSVNAVTMRTIYSLHGMEADDSDVLQGRRQLQRQARESKDAMFVSRQRVANE